MCEQMLTCVAGYMLPPPVAEYVERLEARTETLEGALRLTVGRIELESPSEASPLSHVKRLLEDVLSRSLVDSRPSPRHNTAAVKHDG